MPTSVCTPTDVDARLTAEFAGRARRDQVARVLERCRRDLRGSASSDSLPELLERLARQRLRDQLDEDASLS